MINKSIAYRLSIYISLAVICVFMAYALNSFLFSRKLFKENVENEVISKSSEIKSAMQRYLVSTEEIAFNIAEQILYYGKYNEGEILIRELLAKYDFLNAIHVNIDSTVPNLDYHNYFAILEKDSVKLEKKNNAIYDCPYEIEIINKVKATGKEGWAEPFICPLNNKPIASFYTPIYRINKENDTLIIGEVICELSLIKINEILNAEEIDERGYAFITGKNGAYITHPRKDWIITRNAFTLSDKIIANKKFDVKKAFENFETGKIIAYSEHLEYEKCWNYYTPVYKNGWYIIFVIPYSELYESLYIHLLKLLLISVLGILLVYLVISFITSRLVEPLSKATTQLKMFSSLTGTENEINTSNEVQLVSESLNYLKSWYEKHKVNEKKEQKINRRRLQDLSQASEIQQGFINLDFKAFSKKYNIDLFGVYKPARVVSGDLFDYFFIDDENLMFSIGDVSGKGVPAAIFMSVAQTIIKSKASAKRSKNIIRKANAELYTNNLHQSFLTLFIGVFNIKTRKLNYCNAAHTPPFILKPNGSVVELYESHGLPLGLYMDKKYKSSEIILDEGDTIFLYTDGITELQDVNKLHYGSVRLKENLSHLSSYNAEEIANKIEKSMDVFKGEAKQVDDITALIIKP